MSLSTLRYIFSSALLTIILIATFPVVCWSQILFAILQLSRTILRSSIPPALKRSLLYNSHELAHTFWTEVIAVAFVALPAACTLIPDGFITVCGLIFILSKNSPQSGLIDIVVVLLVAVVAVEIYVALYAHWFWFSGMFIFIFTKSYRSIETHRRTSHSNGNDIEMHDAHRNLKRKAAEVNNTNSGRRGGGVCGETEGDDTVFGRDKYSYNSRPNTFDFKKKHCSPVDINLTVSPEYAKNINAAGIVEGDMGCDYKMVNSSIRGTASTFEHVRTPQTEAVTTLQSPSRNTTSMNLGPEMKNIAHTVQGNVGTNLELKDTTISNEISSSTINSPLLSNLEGSTNVFMSNVNIGDGLQKLDKYVKNTRNNHRGKAEGEGQGSENDAHEINCEKKKRKISAANDDEKHEDKINEEKFHNIPQQNERQAGQMIDMASLDDTLKNIQDDLTEVKGTLTALKNRNNTITICKRCFPIDEEGTTVEFK